MIKWNNKYFPIAALALLLATNVYVLGGVAYNRSGTPLAQITLTERELNLPYGYGYRVRKEDSGIQLQLQWRVIPEQGSYHSYGYYGDRYTNVAWLDTDKLEQLGFDTHYPLTNKHAYRVYGNMPAREVFLVLEYNGDAYQRALKKAESNLVEKEALLPAIPEKEKQRIKNDIKRARKTLQQEQTSRSRLFVIDAGLDPKALREKYADSHRYLVLKGKVDISTKRIKKVTYLRGRVSDVFNERIHIPLPYRTNLAEYTNNKQYRQHKSDKPRFQAELAWGKRYEPWVVAISVNPDKP